MNSAIPRTTNRPPILLLLALALLATLALPQVLASVHIATNPHDETALIRQCAKDPMNLLQIWLNSSGERFNCLIDLGDGRVGDYVLQPCKRGVIEITAYILGSGRLEDAIRTLAAKGCAQIWP